MGAQNDRNKDIEMEEEEEEEEEDPTNASFKEKIVYNGIEFQFPS